MRHTVGQTVFITVGKAKINSVLFLFMKGTNLRPTNYNNIINSTEFLFVFALSIMLYNNNKKQLLFKSIISNKKKIEYKYCLFI